MEADVRKKFMDAGVDVDRALSYFMGREAAFYNLLERFLEDESYQRILDGIEKEDHEGAFRASHNLKGLCGPLAFVELEKVSVEQTELFRADNWEEGKAMMPQVTAAYEKLVQGIRPLLQEERQG